VVIVPPLTGAMIDYNGWTGAAGILAGFYLAGFLISALKSPMRRVTA
jgi:hypothetical protein